MSQTQSTPLSCRGWLWIALLSLLLCAGCGQKPPPAQPPTPVARQTLKIVTYNVLADTVAFDRRTVALANLIDRSDADIVCLQEVTPEFLAALARQPWFQSRYKIPRIGAIPALANGNIILTRTQPDRIEIVVHSSRQGRQSLILWTRIADRTVAIATCHLDSFLEDGPIRAKQLDQLFAALKDADDYILAGDFNFGDGEIPDSDHLDKAYADLWLQLHPGEKGFTWNIETSAMAAKGSFPGEASRRIDRILMQSKNQFWKPAAIAIVGDQPLTPGDPSLFPSDHFGLAGFWEGLTGESAP